MEDDILASLLSPEQLKRAEGRALSSGLLNLGLGLLQGSQGQRGRPSTLSVLGQVGPQAVQAYQGSFDQTLRDIMLGQQMKDAQAKRKQQTAQQSAIDSYISSLSREDQLKFRAAPTQAFEAMFREQPEQFVQLTPEQATQKGLPADKIFQASSKTGKISQVGGGDTNVTVPVSIGTEKKYGETFAAGLAAEDLNLYKAAQSVPNQIETIKETKNLLEQGKVFTGSFANSKLRIAAAGQALGITGKDTNEVISNTQRLFANRAKATLDNVRTSGLGAGQGFTDRDREFLEKAVLGNIEFTPDALKRQIEIEERVAFGTVSRWNDRYKQIPKSALQGTGLDQILSPIEIRPQGQKLRFNPATGRAE